MAVQGRPGGGPQAVIPRYDVPAIAAVWSDEARLATLARDRAARGRGVVRARAWCRRRTRGPAVSGRASRWTAVLERERTTRHDVAAFVDVVAASVGEQGRWIHYGLTSSDVLDTAFALQLRAAADVLTGRLEALLAVVKRRALEHRDTPVDRPQPRGARRAHVVRAQARGVGVRARPRPRAAAAGARGRERGRDQRRGGFVQLGRSPRGAARVRPAGTAPRRTRARR